MKWKLVAGLVPMAFAVISCAHNAAPTAPPVPSRVEPRSGGEEIDRATPERACAFGLVTESCLAMPLNRMRHDSAAIAFAGGLMALNSAGIKQFATDHPVWDGRGVLIAILDSGIDPGVPGLSLTADGSPKVLDLRDFSDEGRLRLQPVVRRGDTLLVGNRRLLGASRVAAVAGDSPIWGGSVVELALGKAPGADINGNGIVGDTLLVVVAKTTSGWALFADTDGDGTLANERPVHDYLVAGELFGWYQRAEARPKRPGAPVNIAVNLADSAGTPVLDLFFDTSSHGTHVSGIAAGHNLYGVAGFDGVAPGAKVIGLKIANDAHGGVSVTGSMVRALDYAIRFAGARAMPLVVNLSFGVGNEHEGTARIDAIIDSILAAHPDVVMTVAAGNDGPGLSTLGFPGSASRVIAVGATLPPVFAGGRIDDLNAESIASYSSRGGEIAGPDVVLPGSAYSSVPNFAIGDEGETGTSMASPYGAGLAARLLSALRASGHTLPALRIRQALRMGARVLPSGFTADQGGGLPDLTRSWQWLMAPHDFAEIAVDIGRVSGRGAIYLTGSSDAATARPLGTRVVLRRLDGNGALTLRLRADASWLQLPETITLAAGRGEFTVGIQPGAAAAPGMLSAAIRVEGPDETAGPLAIIPVVVRTPIPASGTKAPVNVNVTAGGIGRVFVPADTGRGMQIEVATLGASDRVVAALHEPGGMPFRDDRTIPAGFGDGAGLFDIGADDVVAGIYEIDVVAGPLAPIAAKVTVRQAPLRLGATMAHDTLHVTARSLVATPLSVRLRAGLIGAERRITVQRDGDAPTRIAIPVPTWAARMVVDTRMPREQWSRFTDFGLSFLDRHGREFETSPINYAFNRAAPELPDSIAGDTVVVLLSPGFADPWEHGSWSVELSVRFYVEKPFAMDGDGSPFKPVAGGALRDERFPQGALPINLPPEFVPLVTIVALDGPDHIWTREVPLPRPAGPPR
jgi:subtilisin family serine protease